jgi:hypothetical protein
MAKAGILTEFAAGRSPRAIAVDLNVEGIPGPFGNAWGDATIGGHAAGAMASSTMSDEIPCRRSAILEGLIAPLDVAPRKVD